MQRHSGPSKAVPEISKALRRRFLERSACTPSPLSWVTLTQRVVSWDNPAASLSRPMSLIEFSPACVAFCTDIQRLQIVKSSQIQTTRFGDGV